MVIGMTENKRFVYERQFDKGNVLKGRITDNFTEKEYDEVVSITDLLNALHEEVLYWKQVASQRSNEIEVMTHKLQMK